MIPAQATKFVSITPPAAIIDNASATTASVDTKGYDYAVITVYFGAMDIAVTAMKLQESDDDSTYADITGATFAGGYPSATSDNTAWKFYVDLRGRKRYLDLVLTLGDGAAGTYVAAFAELSRAENAPYDITTRGLGGQVIV
ncbi:MAG: hypothetical protein ACO24O_08695 [Arenimonas sp.]